ncbi:hypothetical protein [Mucilaginibacter sp. FT3.2]|uniref:hypothetical protein n=1 Tax=Mucilaginibacter sp. FT3.2 TaxID=2723090 RepID=UPI0016168A42|nr:hypothetical protein [Mucilaginibacter sp. FT3.2]MBB6232082.1 hypothetical protein [Mucilaginibacter sp. FT3.2]
MTMLYNALRTEADPELTDQKNEAIRELAAQNHFFHNCMVTFHHPEEFNPIGMVEFIYKDHTALKAFYTVYIQDNLLRVSLVTLDMVRLIDANIQSFLQKLEAYSFIKDNTQALTT